MIVFWDRYERGKISERSNFFIGRNFCLYIGWFYKFSRIGFWVFYINFSIFFKIMGIIFF